MKKYTQLEIIFSGCLVIVALFAINCGTGPSCPSGTNSTYTTGQDEYSRLSDLVSYQAPGTNSFSPVQSDSCWRPFPGGSSLTTDNTGEAQLNLSSCSDFIYIFRNSQANYDFTYQTCGKMEYENDAGAVCVENGTVLTQECSMEFTTGSGIITKQNSTFSITYLPETETTLLLVLEGEVELIPVLAVEPPMFGESSVVVSGEFIFTMPDDRYQEIEGLVPRQSYPFKELPKVLPIFPIRDWMIDVYDTSLEFDAQPVYWPVELGGEEETFPTPVEELTLPPATSLVILELDGGDLNDPDLQKALFSAIDWVVVQEKGGNDLAFQVLIGTDRLSPLTELTYDPDLTRKILSERGYKDGFPVLILIPDEDAELETLASQLAGYWESVQIKPDLIFIPVMDYDIKVRELIQSQENVVILKKR